MSTGYAERRTLNPPGGDLDLRGCPFSDVCGHFPVRGTTETGLEYAEEEGRTTRRSQ